MGPVGLFALPDHLARLSKTGDPLEVLDQVVEFEQFREHLTKARAIDDLFVAFEGSLRAAGYLPMGGQFVDATLVSAPRQRLTRAEKSAQKDLDARWTVKTGRQLPAIAIPVFGYKNHVAIDRAWCFIRRSAVTDAACYDGSMLRELVTRDNLAASVWADTAYRSAANKAWLADLGRVSRIRRKKPPGRPMLRYLAPRQRQQLRGARSRRARLCLPEGTDGPVRPHHRARPGRTRIGLANLAYNFQRLVFHERRAAVA